MRNRAASWRIEVNPRGFHAFDHLVIILSRRYDRQIRLPFFDHSAVHIPKLLSEVVKASFESGLALYSPLDRVKKIRRATKLHECAAPIEHSRPSRPPQVDSLGKHVKGIRCSQFSISLGLKVGFGSGVDNP